MALAGAAVGIGHVFSPSIHPVARNPSLAKQSFGYAISGFAPTEAIASFALMMAFPILFVFQKRWCRINKPAPAGSRGPGHLSSLTGWKPGPLSSQV